MPAPVKAAAARPQPDAGGAIEWTLSIVSHGHALSINRLLRNLALLLEVGRYEIVVTVNCPEPVAIDAGLWPGLILIRRNTEPHGFASNHNQALAVGSGRYVAMLDPDLRLETDIFPEMARFLAERPKSLAAPQVSDSQGRLQDNMRRLVTPAKLVARYARADRGLDYERCRRPIRVEWIAGLFMAGHRDFFLKQRGFDERFHLYCEDTELSLRYWNAGGEVWVLPFNGVFHDARRRTLSNPRHFAWHCVSLMRLWCSPTFWRYLRQRPAS